MLLTQNAFQAFHSTLRKNQTARCFTLKASFASAVKLVACVQSHQMEADYRTQTTTLHPFSPHKRPQKDNLDAEVSSFNTVSTPS